MSARDSGRLRSWMTLEPKNVGLSTGAEMRLTGGGATAVVCVNGGQRRRGGRKLERVARMARTGLAPRFPQFVFAEVRYRVKSWRRLGRVSRTRVLPSTRGCRADVAAGLLDGRGGRDLGGRRGVGRTGGRARTVDPRRLSLEPLRGKRLDVLHGSLDRWLPGVPGVSPASSRRGFDVPRPRRGGDLRAHPWCAARGRAARDLGAARTASSCRGVGTACCRSARGALKPPPPQARLAPARARLAGRAGA